VRGRETTGLHVVAAFGEPSAARVRPSRSGARTRRARRARRSAGLLRFAVFLLLVFVAVWAGVRVANATVESDAYDARAYTVQSGDTLWKIAAEEYGAGLDLRGVVYAVREANDLDGASLQAGQVLTLPYLEE
jgi:Tfp pilus assembly protein FimV